MHNLLNCIVKGNILGLCKAKKKKKYFHVHITSKDSHMMTTGFPSDETHLFSESSFKWNMIQYSSLLVAQY